MASARAIEHRQVRPDGEGLEHHPEIALLGRQVEICTSRGQQPIAHPYLAVVQILEARDHAQRRGLASARRAEHHDALAFADVEIQPVDRGHGAEAPGHLPT